MVTATTGRRSVGADDRLERRRATALHLALLTLATVACYANSLHVPFVLDDESSIVENSSIGTWTADPRFEPPTRRVAYLTFKLDYLLHGLDPAGFHVTNLLVHVLAAFAVYALARQLLGSAGRDRRDRRAAARWALLGALLFAVHPIQTQAVTYVVQRLASLATLFYVAALALYAAARGAYAPPRVKAGAYAGALVAALLGTWTKEIVFTLPLAVLLFEAAFGGGETRRRVASVAPFLALLPLIPLAVLSARRPAGALLGGVADATRVETPLSRLDYLATQARVVVTYLRLVVLPVNQNLDHDITMERGLGSPAVLLCAAFLFALAVAGALLLGRRRPAGLRVAGFGILLFFLGLAVESSLIPIVDVMFEHRVYLPMAGVALVAAGLASHAAERWPGARRWVVPAAAAWLVALGVATVARNRVWRDPVTLWSDAARKSPGKARPHYNLGNAHLARGDLAAAERSWKRAAEVDPRHSWALNQLGTLALTRGEPGAAEAFYRRALEGEHVNPDAAYNLALVLEGAGRAAESRDAYRRFVELDPPERAQEVAHVRARFGWR